MIYRIGDWVRIDSPDCLYEIGMVEVAQVSSYNDIYVDLKLGNTIIYSAEYHEITKWIPEEREYCWHNKYGLVRVSVYDEIEDLYVVDTIFNNYHDTTLTEVDSLEPFVGQLPSFFYEEVEDD